MSTEYDNTDRGVLFQNDKRESESHPHYKGRINVGGTDFWLAAWKKKAKSGNTFLSISVGDEITEQEPPKKAPAKKGGKAPAKKSQPVDDMDDDIPF